MVGQRASWPGFIEALGSSAPHLCRNILREALDSVSVREGGERALVAFPIAFLKGMPCQRTIAADFEGQYRPSAAEEARRASAALTP